MERIADIDSETQSHWILGGDVEGVSFHMCQEVVVTSGPYAGASGQLISLYSLVSEPLFHLESPEGEDFHVYQSEIERKISNNSLKPDVP